MKALVLTTDTRTRQRSCLETGCTSVIPTATNEHILIGYLTSNALIATNGDSDWTLTPDHYDDGWLHTNRHTH